MLFTIGRSPKGRASLMHEMSPDRRADGLTLCGRDMRGGSRAYVDVPIMEVMCLRCIASRARRDRLRLP